MARIARAWLLGALVALIGCGENSASDCACTVAIGAESITLGCGESGCVAGSRFGCDEDNVVPLGRCASDLGTPGLSDAGMCLLPDAPCTGSAYTCCPVATDGGTLAPSCDPISQRCCVPDGQRCATSTDCCNGAICIATGGEPRCAR